MNKPYARMTPAERKADRRQFDALMAHMKAHGWTHTSSIMDDCGTGGLCFEKDGRRFIANQETRHNLPQD